MASATGRSAKLDPTLTEPLSANAECVSRQDATAVGRRVFGGWQVQCPGSGVLVQDIEPAQAYAVSGGQRLRSMQNSRDGTLVLWRPLVGVRMLEAVGGRTPTTATISPAPGRNFSLAGEDVRRCSAGGGV